MRHNAMALLLLLCFVPGRQAANPIVPGIGMADPHMHVWKSNPGQVYLYATHDCNKAGHGPCTRQQLTPSKLGFYMTDWWVWR